MKAVSAHCHSVSVLQSCLWSNEGNELERLLLVPVRCPPLDRAPAAPAPADTRKHIDGIVCRTPAHWLCRATGTQTTRPLTSICLALAISQLLRRNLGASSAKDSAFARFRKAAAAASTHSSNTHTPRIFQSPFERLSVLRLFLSALPFSLPRYVAIVAVAPAPCSPPRRTVHRTGRRTTTRTHEPDGGGWCVEHE